jgi:monoamine oxidase
MQTAIASVAYAVTGKSGLQFNRRFWEEDEDIFGGITNTNQDITQIWHPSTGYLSNKGVMLGTITLVTQLHQEWLPFTVQIHRRFHRLLQYLLAKRIFGQVGQYLQ